MNQLRGEKLDKAVELFINKSNLNLSEKLPKGIMVNLIKEVKRKPSTINMSIARIRRKNKIILKTKTPNSLSIFRTKKIKPIPISRIVAQYVNQHNLDLTKRVDTSTMKDISEKTGLGRRQIRDGLHAVRRRRGINTDKKSQAPTSLVAAFSPFNVERKSPNKNKVSSDIILRKLIELPRGGSSMIIGTSTPFATSPSPKNNLLLTDELEIAVALKMTCDTLPDIVIGNLVSPQKAEIKRLFWKNINTTTKCNVSVGPLDRDAYTHHVTRLSERDQLTKVVLITSGVWKCCPSTRKKYGYDFNFQSPSLYLSSVYPKLHILAMVQHNNLFKVHHVHKGEETIVE